MSAAVVLEQVSKSFGDKHAVRELDLVVPAGALYGFIGPNGAGKTTLLRMILSILLPDRGKIAVLGRGSALEARDRVGYLPEERGLYRKMKVGALLSYLARLKGVERGAARRRARAWLERVGLESVLSKRCEELSKGMQQKVGFVAAVINQPELVVLDEPFSGLDPVSTRLLRELVVELHAGGATILFSTHVMAQAEELCERVVMLHQGLKVLDASVAEIRGSYDPRTIRFEPLDPDADPARLRALRSVRALEQNASFYRILLEPDADPRAALAELVATQAPARVELERKSLEDVFVEIVSGNADRASEQSLRAALAEQRPVEDAR